MFPDRDDFGGMDDSYYEEPGSAYGDGYDDGYDTFQEDYDNGYDEDYGPENYSQQGGAFENGPDGARPAPMNKRRRRAQQKQQEKQERQAQAAQATSGKNREILAVMYAFYLHFPCDHWLFYLL